MTKRVSLLLVIIAVIAVGATVVVANRRRSAESQLARFLDVARKVQGLPYRAAFDQANSELKYREKDGGGIIYAAVAEYHSTERSMEAPWFELSATTSPLYPRGRYGLTLAIFAPDIEDLESRITRKLGSPARRVDGVGPIWKVPGGAVFVHDGSVQTIEFTNMTVEQLAASSGDVQSLSAIRAETATAPHPPQITAVALEVLAPVTIIERASTQASLSTVDRKLIERSCSERWPTNPDAQGFCHDEGIGYLAKFKRPKPSILTDVAYAGLINRCVQMYPSDIEMREYCRRQLIFAQLQDIESRGLTSR
jgi:hypothetical protein